MNRGKLHIADFLLGNAEAGYSSFHMPGHKGAAIFREFGYGDFLDNMVDCDVTEIIGADNLFKAEGIIGEAQARWAALYGVKRSYLLVNGTSGGLIAAILAAAPRGSEVIMARNCHKSVFNALTLADLRPVYGYPEIIPEFGVTGEVAAAEIDRLLEEHPQAAAVVLPSPNYYGICSDIEAIAETVHRHGRVLIVDQAHGAHLKFCSFWDGFKMSKLAHFKPVPERAKAPLAAEDCGADIVVNSIHKTLASFTQSAVLNLCSDRVDPMILEDKLQTIESSSPSYMLMAGLEIAADMMENHGAELMKRWGENLDYAYARLEKIEGLRLMKADRFDRTKINLDMSQRGLDGGELELELLKHGVRCELTTGNILMCMTGVGNSRADFEKLADALEAIAEDNSLIANRRCGSNPNGYDSNANGCDATPTDQKIGLPKGRPELCQIPARKEVILLKDAAGRICGSSIIPYPPGIPLVCPGERITDEIVAYVESLIKREEKVIGVSTDGRVIVGI